MKYILKVPFQFAVFVFLVLACGQVSGKLPDKSWLSGVETDLNAWQQELEQWNIQRPPVSQLEQRQNEVFSIRKKTDECVKSLEPQLAAIDKKIAALGEEAGEDSAEIKSRRKELSKEKQSVETELSICKLHALGTRELLDNYQAMRNQILSEALSHRGQPVWKTLFRLLTKPGELLPEIKFDFDYWHSSLVGVIALLVFYPLAQFFSGLFWQRYPLDKTTDESANAVLIAQMFARRLPWIAVVGSLAIFAYMGNAILLSQFLLAVVVSLGVAPLIEMALCQDVRKCSQGFPARLLVALFLVGLAMYLGGLKGVLGAESFKVLHAIYLLLVSLCSLWLMLALSKRQGFQFLMPLRVPLGVAMLTGPIAMWLGYQSLSDLLVPGVYGTLAGLLVAWMIYYAGYVFLSMFEPDSAYTSVALRQFLGYRDKGVLPGLWLVKTLWFLAVALLVIYLLLVVWKVPESDINTVNSYLVDGFELGAYKIEPVKILSAVLAFFVLLTFARWFRNQLTERWLSKTLFDAGARESIVSLTTYAIVGLALVIALGMAGVDFQNVAIIAGALSVGIGFGLQNIVSNFISGLILLFERPVKPGDWVVVGATEGYVKKISIRYTLIETFDRAEVMVPNSELISSQVTNWMHRDSIGRVIVPVGVAYGTDTGQVRDILLKIAAEHPLVIQGDFRVSDPKVRFMAFGESSLDFELRCFISEVDNRLSVRSDLLFSIDNAFREAGIEIPFPQRVVHLPEKDTDTDQKLD